MSNSYEVREVELLDDSLKKELSDFRRNNGDGSGVVRTDEEMRVRADKYCSGGDIKRWILVFDQGSLIGVTAVFGRTILVNGERVLMGGVGRVRVRKDSRKRGVATKMMSRAMEVLKELNYDVAFLCTNLDSFLADFYRKYGFVVLHKSYTYLGKSGKRYTDEDGMLAVVKSKEVFDKIIEGEDVLDIGVGNW